MVLSPNYYVRVESEFSEHVPLPPSHDILNIKTDNFETKMVIESSEIEVLTNTSSDCGEFHLEIIKDCRIATQCGRCENGG